MSWKYAKFPGKGTGQGIADKAMGKGKRCQDCSIGAIAQ